MILLQRKRKKDPLRHENAHVRRRARAGAQLPSQNRSTEPAEAPASSQVRIASVALSLGSDEASYVNGAGVGCLWGGF